MRRLINDDKKEDCRLRNPPSFVLKNVTRQLHFFLQNLPKNNGVSTQRLGISTQILEKSTQNLEKSTQNLENSTQNLGILMSKACLPIAKQE